MITNLEYYRVFYYAASEGSFTRAAQKLCVTQSAVSQTIKRLEESCGCRLFYRTTNGLVLSKEGEILYESLQNAFHEIDQGERLMQEQMQAPSYLCIGTVLTALQAFLSPVLLQYQKKHPEIHVQIHEDTVHHLTQMLESGEISLAFLVTPLEYGTRLDLRKAAVVQDVACVSKDFPMNLERIYTPQQLLEYPVISTDRRNGIRATIDEWFWDSGLIFSPAITTRSGAEAEELTRQGFGIGILPEEAVKDDLEKGILKRVRTTSLPKERIIYAAVKQREGIGKAEKELLDMIKEYLSGESSC